MGQYLCCIDETQSELGNRKEVSSVIQRGKNSEKVTKITIDGIAQDLIGDSSQLNNIFDPNEKLSFQVSFNTFQFQKLTMRDKIYIIVSLSEDPELTFQSEMVDVDSQGNAMELYNQKESLKPISTIMIDYFSLSICPQHCEFDLRHSKKDKTIGRIIFDVEFQQLQEIQIVLSDLKCKIEAKEERPYYSIFKAITNSETATSQQTTTLFGEYDKKKNKTNFHWGVAESLYADPTVIFTSTMENLKQSTIQMCLYENKEFYRSDQIRKKSKQSNSSEDEDTFTESTPVANAKKDLRFSKFTRSSTQRNVFNTNMSPIKQEKNQALLSKQRTMLKRKTSTQDAVEFYKDFKGEILKLKATELEDEDIGSDLRAECYIGFQKLLKSELRVFDRRDSFILKNSLSMSRKLSNISFDSKGGSFRAPTQSNQNEDLQLIQQNQRQQVKKFKEKISLAGKYIGTLKGSFKISNTPILQQMGLGILTDKGIYMTAAPVLADTETSLFFFKRSRSNQKISDLTKNFQKLKEIDSLKGRKANRAQQEKENALSEIIQILQSSDQKDLKIFFYENDLALIGAQQTLIELGFHCLLYAGNVKYEQRHYYYSILTLLFERGEFRLPAIGFFGSNQFEGILGIDSETLSSQGLKKEQVLQERLKIAKFYQKLLYTALDDSITKFQRKGVELYLRTYIEKYLSAAYFRIPEFRKTFIECVLKKSNEPIEELKNTQWYIEQHEDEEGASIQHLLDWNNYFHNLIPQSQEKNQTLQILRRVIYNTNWQKKIEKRTVAFYQIISKLLESMNVILINLSQKQKIFWQDVPGYNQILRAFLLEMKTLDINEYPDAFVDASLSFLSNTQLLSVFVNIIFKKTKIVQSNDRQKLIAQVSGQDLLNPNELNLNQKSVSQADINLKKLRKQQTVNLDILLAEIQNNTEEGDHNNDFDAFDELILDAKITTRFSSKSKVSFYKKEIERKKNLQLVFIISYINIFIQVANTHKLLKQKFEEIESLQKYLTKKQQRQGGSIEKEYDFDDEESGDNNDADLDIAYNRITNKVPEELKVYIQDKTLIQFYKEMKEYEKWKIKMGADDKQVFNIPDVNVESGLPVDDIFEFNKTMEY